MAKKAQGAPRIGDYGKETFPMLESPFAGRPLLVFWQTRLPSSRLQQKTPSGAK